MDAQTVIVGKEGITDNLIKSCNESLNTRELIKVKLGQNCPVEKKEAAKEIAQLIKESARRVTEGAGLSEKAGESLCLR